MKKTKCYCDYCGKECKETNDLVLPVREEIKEYATNRYGVKLVEFTTGEKVSHKQQDICNDCQEKMTYILNTNERKSHWL